MEVASIDFRIFLANTDSDGDCGDVARRIVFDLSLNDAFRPEMFSQSSSGMAWSYHHVLQFHRIGRRLCRFFLEWGNFIVG